MVKKKSKWTTREKVMFVVFVLMVFGALLFGGNKDVAKLETTPTATPSATLSPEDDAIWKETFMEGCLESGEASYSQCSCAYDYMRDRMSLSDYIEVAMEYDETGEIPDIMYNAVAACLDE